MQALAGEQDLAALHEHAKQLMELNLSALSHSNETANMTVAVVSMLFVPVTFVAGVYGRPRAVGVVHCGACVCCVRLGRGVRGKGGGEGLGRGHARGLAEEVTVTH